MGTLACSHSSRICRKELNGQGRWPKQEPIELEQAIIQFCAICTSSEIVSAKVLPLQQNWDYLSNLLASQSLLALISF